MKESDPSPLGGDGKVVESDETLWAARKGPNSRREKWTFSNEHGWPERR